MGRGGPAMEEGERMLTPGEADVLDEARATVKAVAEWLREQEAPLRWFEMTPLERLKQIWTERMSR